MCPAPRGAATAAAGAQALQRLVQALRSIQIARGAHPWLLLDLTMAQLKALILVVQSGGMRSRELADGLGIAPSAATPLVDRLTRQRLLRRDDDPQDRRVVWIRATARASAIYDQLMEANEEVLGEVLAEIPAAERAGVHAALHQLIGAAERVLARPLPSKQRRPKRTSRPT